MYENGKMKPVDTIPGKGGGEDKGERCRDDFNHDVL
jgi:hypothetical protein